MSYMAYIEEKNVKMPLHFLDAAYIDGYFWVNALEWNAYYRVNVETGYAEFLGRFKNAEPWSNKLFNQILDYGEYVFFIPWFSNYLVRLDTKNLETKYYKLPSSIIPEIAKFRVAVIYENKIYMFPHISDNICIFDIKEEVFMCDKNWAEEFSKFETKDIKDRFVQGCKVKEYFFGANFSGNFLMKYNMISKDYEMIFFPKNEEKIIDVVLFDNNKLLILTWAGNVWSYHISNGNKKLIYKYDGDIEFPFIHVIARQEYFLLIPALEEKIVSFNKNKKDCILYPTNWKKQYINVGIECVFCGYYEMENTILLYPCLGNMLLELDVSKKTLRTIRLDGENDINLKKYIKEIDDKEEHVKIYGEDIIGYQIWNGVKDN